ncbi:MAG: DEAD/DEAH box helicase family protein [Bacteroidales bacterium]|nr:DEAD/DEAH box helicase family protein [Candidatus Sodaliphilus limicaballi]
MSSKFFNNIESPLIEKFKGIAENMHDFHTFQAVAGYFRSSGYFKLRKHLEDVKKIQILVGINIDNIFKKHDKSLLMLEGEDEARAQYTQDFIKDVMDAKYSAEVEEGILQLCDDLASGKVEMRIDKSKNLHAKFYLCLPEEHNENSDGWVIMGSSNISDSGLGTTQPPRYELNVAMKDYEDVKYCKEEFEKLWNESIPLSPEDIARIRKKTHLDNMPTPYELYIKVLIDAFGNQVEDNFTMSLPEGYMPLKYQKDAVIQGFQMLKEYNGFFLADVVGTGKTVVGTMIAKRFIEENGKDTNVLIVYPPALKNNWEETVKDFKITKYVQFVSNGSLDKVLEEKNNYKGPEEFDLIIVDEAHNFRSDSAERYDELQRICKTPRVNEGFIEGVRKKVMLLSATPLNNRPEDFLNLILLFQDARNPTIDGINNLNVKFQPWIKRYKEAMAKRHKSVDSKELLSDVDMIYEEMRTEVLDKILVRRTRKNLLNNDDYRADLDKQGIKFPHIERPNECIYQMDSKLSALFYHTISILTDTRDADNPDGEGLNYARYRAIEFLTGEARNKYKQAQQVTTLLQGIYRVHMVKRLESSFSAFKTSLHTFLRITNDMIKMFEENKILIAPDYDVKGMMAKDMELDQIIENLVEKGLSEKDFVYESSDFSDELLELLQDDAAKLAKLCERWDKVSADPKLDEFISLLNNELFDENRNAEGNYSGIFLRYIQTGSTINGLRF